ncbi:MAG: DUF3644 domain-containing protein, partial [Opitutales bacterium]|nr:DUF3644 domain-containing protein [Opitutales bacterium]
ELLIKAKWLKEHKLSTLYVRIPKKKKDNSQSKRFGFKISRSGNPITHEVLYLINKMNEKSVAIDANIVKNIELILEARDCIIHFYTDDFMLNKRIREVGLASLENYIYLVKEWFNVEIGEFGFSLVPVSVVDTSKSLKSQPSTQEKTFLLFLDKCIKDQNTMSDRLVALEVNIALKRTFASDSLAKVAIDPKSPTKIAISEEDMSKLYPWEHSELLINLKKRYSDFRQDKKFNKLKKDVHKNNALSYERKLSPKNIKSPKRHFYSPNCLQYFDNYYTKIR